MMFQLLEIARAEVQAKCSGRQEGAQPVNSKCSLRVHAARKMPQALGLAPCRAATKPAIVASRGEEFAIARSCAFVATARLVDF
jgi:hypothetical protein